MSLRDSFVSGGASLADFFRAFHLDVGPSLRLLRKTHAVATGVQVALFMSGRWKQEQERNPKAFILDVLCYTPKARGDLQRLLARAGYSVCETACCHNLGEWKHIPSSKRTCMVQGPFMQRVVHLIELPRPVVQTALSRVYGSMAGTYLTGGGRAVSLFPQITFVERRVWVPERYSEKARSAVEGKYTGWKAIRAGRDAGEEISSSARTVSDDFVWSMAFHPDTGALLSERSSGTLQPRCVVPTGFMFRGQAD